MHILCLICSDLVNHTETIYVTKCGHIYHLQCLAKWIERSNSCPQCRCKVTKKFMFRLFPTISNESSSDDVATLQSRLDDATLNLRQSKAECNEKDNRIRDLLLDLHRKKKLISSCQLVDACYRASNKSLRKQIEGLIADNLRTQKSIKTENEDLKKNIQILKGALCESASMKSKSRVQLTAAKRQIAIEKSTVADLQNRLTQMEDKLVSYESMCASMKNKRKAVEPSAEASQPKQSRVEDSVGSDDIVMVADNVDASLPSEFAILNAARNTALKRAHPQPTTSIFPKKPDPGHKPPAVDRTLAYDGLGGRSTPDTFPVPLNKSQSRVPNITAKHRLKRPTTSAS